MEDKGLVCINDGRGTRYESAKNKESAIDLTLTSNVLEGITTWKVLSESPVGSDHYPVSVTIGVEVEQEEVMKISRWK